jgi:hypothetical protein
VKWVKNNLWSKNTISNLWAAFQLSSGFFCISFATLLKQGSLKEDMLIYWKILNKLLIFINFKLLFEPGAQVH